MFQPCGHKSCKYVGPVGTVGSLGAGRDTLAPGMPSRCRACIDQHLMNNKDCFFCKATIVSVEDWDKAANASATSSAA